eukprot:11227159-Lingulodinium_polyedra.AAC.1
MVLSFRRNGQSHRVQKWTFRARELRAFRKRWSFFLDETANFHRLEAPERTLASALSRMCTVL